MLISDIMVCTTNSGRGMGVVVILYNHALIEFETAHRALKTFRSISPFLRAKYAKERLNLIQPQ